MNLNENKLRNLKGAFDKKNGTVTAGNASQLSDGAACLILCSGKYLKDRYQKSINQMNNSNNNSESKQNNIDGIVFIYFVY